METKTLCRVCMDVGQFSLTDYEVNVLGENISILLMIQKFSDIELLDGNIPEMICETCTHDLVQAYVFTVKIQQADERILNLLQTNQEVLEVPPLVDEEEITLLNNHEDEEVEEVLSQTSQVIEERYTDVDEDENDTNLSIEAEEVYFDTKSPGLDELIIIPESTKRKYTKTPQIILTDNVSSLLANYKSGNEDFIEPKRKVYCKKDKRSKEISENGSFVIAQFTPSSPATVHHDNLAPEDNDEVTLSDIRTMNFGVVEVKADNMTNSSQYDQGELPIDDSRVYLCQYCPKAFSSSAFLTVHVRKSHGCKYCAQMFNKYTDLYKHIREEHTSFKCVVCEKDFISNSNLRNHLKTVHKVKVPANVALLSYKRPFE